LHQPQFLHRGSIRQRKERRSSGITDVPRERQSQAPWGTLRVRSKWRAKKRLCADALLQQGSRCPLGVAYGTKLASIQTFKRALGGKEAVPFLVLGNDTRGPTLHFDNKGFGHDSSLAASRGAPAWRINMNRLDDRGSATVARGRRDATSHHELTYTIFF
jgi:hypothetical protein